MQPGKRSYVVKRTNTGLGLFATKPIARGERIIEYKGPLVPDEVVYERGGKYFFGVNRKWSIDGSPRSNVARTTTARSISRESLSPWAVDAKGVASSPKHPGRMESETATETLCPRTSLFCAYFALG